MNIQNQKSPRESRILRDLMGEQFYKAMVACNGFIAGGAVRSVFAAEPINDFDIFFRNKENFDEMVGVLGESDESPIFTTSDTAWTHCGNKMRYQLICAEFGEPEQIISKFDFSMCMAAWVPTEGFFVDEKFFQHIAGRRLVFNANAAYPICSLWRAFKFVKRGWKLSAIEAIKLSLCIHNVSLKDRAELKRQLLGIDTLFLKELTDALANQGDVKYDYGEAIDFISNFVDSEDSEA